MNIPNPFIYYARQGETIEAQPKETRIRSKQYLLIIVSLIVHSTNSIKQEYKTNPFIISLMHDRWKLFEPRVQGSDATTEVIQVTQSSQVNTPEIKKAHPTVVAVCFIIVYSYSEAEQIW